MHVPLKHVPRPKQTSPLYVGHGTLQPGELYRGSHSLQDVPEKNPTATLAEHVHLPERVSHVPLPLQGVVAPPGQMEVH